MAVGFYTRSVAVLSSLYGLLFGFLTLIFYFFVVIQDAGLGFAGISFTAVALIAIAGLFIQFLISPWIMDLMLRWVYDFDWISMEQLPSGMRDAIQSTMQQYNFTIGKVGIIHDGMPNAFTYGRFRSGARIVFTQGLIDMLNEEEQIAVVQHEMGHIVNYDFLFMTLASAIPLLFYYMYRTSKNIGDSMGKSSNGSSSSESNANPAVIFYGLAVVAFIIYEISHLIVLLLSRYREHSADIFSAHTTQNPSGLSTALVKIAYGLVSAETEVESRIKDDNTSASDKRKLRRQVSFSSRMGAMGLADVNTSKGLVMQAVAGGNEVNPETVAAAATWDLQTPWAKFIELSSTHPLTGKRLKALDDTAEDMGIMRKYPDLGKIRPPESLWDEFTMDLFVMYVVPWLILILPITGYIIGLFTSYNPLLFAGVGFIGVAAFWYLRVQIKYPGDISNYEDPNKEPNTVLESLSSMEKDGYYEASPVRGKSIIIEGVVGGRGQPGYILSEDFMVQDSTGFIVIDYSSVIPFYNLWFGYKHVREMMGKRVRVVGWYHRSIMPRIQLHRLIILDENKVRKNRWRGANLIFAGLLAAIGVLVMIYSMGMI